MRGKYHGSDSITSQVLPGYRCILRLSRHKRDFVVETGAIAVEVFAERDQALIVAFLRKEYGVKCLDLCETYWTGRRGRMCPAHSRYSR